MKQQPTTEEQQGEQLVVLEARTEGSLDAIAELLLKIALYTLDEDRVQSTNQTS